MSEPASVRPIPMLDLRPEVEALWPDLAQGFEQVVRSGSFILGPHGAAFEAEVAAYLGVAHAIGTNSGTDALVIAMRALGIGPGDEVIVPTFTFVATASTVSLAGATPVFVDVDPVAFAIDPGAVDAAVTDRTKAIIPVHLFGLSAPMIALQKVAESRGLVVIEDTAQAFGADSSDSFAATANRAAGPRKLGSLGDAGAFSFYPTKNLGAYGDGGMVVTNDDEVALRARKLRTHGSLRPYENELLGYTSRLDELQAMILRLKFPSIDAANEGRRRVAAAYSMRLGEVEGVVLPTDRIGCCRHIYHQYTLRIGGGRRDAVREALTAAGVSSMIYYPTPVHRLPLYHRDDLSFAVADQLATEVLSLPIWPTMAEDDIDRVADCVRSALA